MSAHPTPTVTIPARFHGPPDSGNGGYTYGVAAATVGPGPVQVRLRVYAEQSAPIVEYYRRRPTFRSVDGDQPQESVAADISSAVASVLGGE